jgi:ferritin-like metal-binding protein YciE
VLAALFPDAIAGRFWNGKTDAARLNNFSLGRYVGESFVTKQLTKDYDMKLATLKDLYLEELRDVYSAETQLVKALPKMSDAATHDELRGSLDDHFDQTKEHVERLDQIFESLGESAKGKRCKGMEGLIAEAQELLGEDADSDVLDAGIISMAQRIEHYEIAAYGCLCTYARLLQRDDDHDLLGQTLEEEKESDENLTEIAEGAINVEANEEEEAEGDTSEIKSAKKSQKN